MAPHSHPPPLSSFAAAAAAPVHFQIPSFVCSTAPTLAPGGGAEVLPVSLFSDNPLATTWFSNSGFTPHPPDDQYPPSTEQRQQQQHHQHHQHQRYLQPQPTQSLSAPFDFDSYIVRNPHPSPPIPTPPPAPPPPQPRTLTQAELSAFTLPQHHAHASTLLHPPLLPDLSAPSPLGLPVYSTSGFDLLSILARVANRPHPRVVLGPVDLTCSFVVVDVRRHDHPIVYCSPSFCLLTGYSEKEVLGRNCRFLQAPNGQVHRGDLRRYTSPDAVAHLKKNLCADKECQTSIVNYRKDGTPFINLVTVIPILGGVSGTPHEDSEVVYHVGFQVDLTQQPDAIREKLRDGSYVVDYSSQRSPYDISITHPSSKDRKAQAIPTIRISKDLKKLLQDPSFVSSIPISSSTTIPPSQPLPSVRNEIEHTSSSSVSGINQLLHLLLLEASPDFIYVVSLKGSFLYVAPSVRRVLGYEAEELVGGNISDFAHPEDVVPLMRELKEGSATGLATVSSSPDGGAAPAPPVVGNVAAGTDHSIAGAPRAVDLLFRARTKTGVYIWVECRGRLYPEPGKGRKAIILCARAKQMPRLGWSRVAHGGGLAMPVYSTVEEGEAGKQKQQQTGTEVWGMISGGGGDASFLVVGAAVTDLLGWAQADLVGRAVIKFAVEGAQDLHAQICLCQRGTGDSLTVNPRRVFCRIRHKDGSSVDVFFVLYQAARDPLAVGLAPEIRGITPVPLIFRLCLAHHSGSASQSSASLAHPLAGDVFEELDTDRESSWQYELQQIRFANHRLEDEISVLEKQLEKVNDVQQKVLNNLQQNQRQQEMAHYARVNPSFTRLQPPLDPHQQPLPESIPPPLPHSPDAPFYSAAALGSFMHFSHLQPSNASFTMPTSKNAHSPLLPFDWDPAAAQNPGQNHVQSHGLKRPWDVAITQ